MSIPFHVRVLRSYGLAALAVCAALMLSACGGRYASDREFTQPIAKGKPVEAGPGQGVVLLGYRVMNFADDWGTPQSGWISIDPTTGLRNNKTMVELDSRGWRLDQADAGKGITEYRAYALPPGTYALGWVWNSRRGYFFPSEMAIKLTSGGYGAPTRTFSDGARVRPNTPTFSLQAGDVVYVGDLLLDFTKASFMRWARETSENGARGYAANMGYKGPIAVRLMRRADGAEFSPSDGVGSSANTTYK